jgi:KDO2-lipid IV(A) lauroyltransferase
MQRVGPRLRKTHPMRRNLVLAWPDKTPTEIDALVKAVWGNLGAVLAEYPHLKKLSKSLEIVGKDMVEPLREQGKPAIFVTAHLANWELAAAAILQLQIPVTGLYAPLQNPLTNRMLERRRRALGSGLLSKHENLRLLLRQLNEGRSIGFLTDQRVDNGELLPFFKLAALTTMTPARLALKHNCKLIPVRIERLSGVQFRVTFYPPIMPPSPQQMRDTRDSALVMTQTINALFETWIRKQPAEWLCAKRRWPKTVMAPTSSDETTMTESSER